MFKPFRNQGFFTEAFRLLVEKAFSRKLFELRETIREDCFRKHYANIDIIRAEIRVSNVPSQKAAQSCGFEECYIDRRHAIIEDTRFEDCIIYELERR